MRCSTKCFCSFYVYIWKHKMFVFFLRLHLEVQNVCVLPSVLSNVSIINILFFYVWLLLFFTHHNFAILLQERQIFHRRILYSAPFARSSHLPPVFWRTDIRRNSNPKHTPCFCRYIWDLKPSIWNNRH